MAKSSKTSSKKGTPSKKPTKKSAKKSVAVKKTVAAKKTVNTKKAAGKKAIAKKAMPKKQLVKKARVASKVVKKAEVKNKTIKTSRNGIEKIKAKKVNKSGPSLAELNERTANVNDYTEMIKGNTEMPDQKITNNDERGDELIAMPRSIPAPEEKYRRPADPYHGHTATVKGKRTIAPSGKKPLWNK